MRIENQNTSQPICFKNFSRAVYNSRKIKYGGSYNLQEGLEKGYIKHTNNSWMFRPGLYKCRDMYSFISNAYRHENKINVYDYGCSLGYGTYSFILGFLRRKNIEKYFPVMAKDYDKDIIEEAKKYTLPLQYGELYDIKKILRQENINQFMALKDDSEKWQYIAYPTDVLKNKVCFSVADIRDDYENIAPINSFIMATNFWPYIPQDDKIKLAKNLYYRLEKNSYIKIDMFDNNQKYLNGSTPAETLLLDAGFKKTKIENLFKK